MITDDYSNRSYWIRKLRSPDDFQKALNCEYAGEKWRGIADMFALVDRLLKDKFK
jgi:hypothetical protein